MVDGRSNRPTEPRLPPAPRGGGGGLLVPHWWENWWLSHKNRFSAYTEESARTRVFVTRPSEFDHLTMDEASPKLFRILGGGGIDYPAFAGGFV